MTDENLTIQTDEMMVLSSIFDKALKQVGDDCYSVAIDEESAHFTITIFLNNNYPSQAPPIYSIICENLNSKEREQLDAELGSIYCDNAGDAVVFQWIEHIRVFLSTRCDKGDCAVSVGGTKEIYNKEQCDKETKHEEDESEKGNESKNEEDESEEKEEYEFKDEYSKSGKSSIDNEGVQLPPIHHGEQLKDRKSTFQGHLAPVFSKQQVDMVMASLKENKKIAAATHNILAYRIELGNGGYNSGCVDDGEFGASARMLNLLNIVDARNVMVVVTRWYGGIHLGPDRFKHINNITRDLLDEHGYIKLKANAKKNQKPTSDNNSKISRQKKKR